MPGYYLCPEKEKKSHVYKEFGIFRLVRVLSPPYELEFNPLLVGGRQPTVYSRV